MSVPAAMLPYGRHQIEDDDIAAVTAVLRSDFLTTGPVVDAFEAEFARQVGSRFAVSCASGTAGLHMAAMALNLGPGDAVVVPTLTFLATANAVRYVGAEVIFADVDPATGQMMPHHLAPALAQAARSNLRIKAVFPVHYAGQSASTADLRADLAAADRADVAIVEDACHAIGTVQQDSDGMHRIGDCHHTRMAVFSLHPVKTICMGEGGVVTTNDEATDRALRRARNHGMVREAGEFANQTLAFDADGTPNPWYYEMPELGYNYRASAIHCALGLSQLGKLDRFVARRRELVARYDAQLKSFAPVIQPLGRTSNCEPAWHLYAARIDFAGIGKSRAAMVRELAALGVGTQVHYLPVHLQPYYRARYGEQKLSGAEELYSKLLSLPLYPSMTDDDVERVVTALAQVTGARG